MVLYTSNSKISHHVHPLKKLPDDRWCYQRERDDEPASNHHDKPLKQKNFTGSSSSYKHKLQNVTMSFLPPRSELKDRYIHHVNNWAAAFLSHYRIHHWNTSCITVSFTYQIYNFTNLQTYKFTNNSSYTTKWYTSPPLPPTHYTICFPG